MAVYAALFTLAKGLSDDDEKKKRTGLLDAAMSEVFLIDQIRQGYSTVGSTSASIAFAGKLGQALLDVANGDFPQAQRFFTNIGAVKFYNQVSDVVNPPAGN